MTYAFAHGEISPSSPSGGWDLGFLVEALGQDLVLKDGIWAMRLRFGCQGWFSA